jgi:hypothetical protein
MGGPADDAPPHRRVLAVASQDALRVVARASSYRLGRERGIEFWHLPRSMFHVKQLRIYVSWETPAHRNDGAV